MRKKTIISLLVVFSIISASTISAYADFIIKFDQKIICPAEITKPYGIQQFRLDYKLVGNGKITFKSSSSAVATISKNSGVVTVKGPGIAKLTINAAKTYFYRAASESVLLKVLPKASNINTVSTPKSGSLCIKWTRSPNCSNYEIQIARNSKFANADAYSSSSVSISKTISKLLPKKRYYVRIRALKKSKGEILYSTWSKTKNLIIK